MKNETNRQAIIEAAIAIVAEQGLSAPTAAIAKQARVAHGSVFNHFATKIELLNALYLQLKEELNETVLEDLPDTHDAEAQLHHLWARWLRWGTANPARRRALAQLSVSDQITEASRAASFERSAIGIEIVQRASASGSLKDESIDFVGGIVEALAGATMDYIIRNPTRAEVHREAAFRALWKALQ